MDDPVQRSGGRVNMENKYYASNYSAILNYQHTMGPRRIQTLLLTEFSNGGSQFNLIGGDWGNSRIAAGGSVEDLWVFL